MNIEVVNSSKAPAAIGPYSQAIKVGNLVFTSGQIPLNSKAGELAGESIEKQVHQSILNLKNVLESSGSGLDKTIKNTLFIVNMDDFQIINKIYSEYFTTCKPARSCVEVSALPKGAKFEIESVALCEE